MSQEFLVSQLKNRPPAESLAILAAMDKKRRDENFVRYWTPQEQQLPHFKQFTKDIKIFGILGGNRSGKTEEGAFLTMVWALGKEFFRDEPTWEIVKDLPVPDPPNNIWIVGLDYPTLRDVIWREKLRAGRNHPPLLPRDGKTVTKVLDGDYQIFFANGSTITGKSADSGREKFQSASIDLVWIDEECDVSVFDECFQRTVDCAGKILLTLTPLVDTSSGVKTPWVFDLYEDSHHGRNDIKFVKLNVLENPFVPAEEKIKLQEKWVGHYEEGARLYGDFIRRSGLVYPDWDKKVHCIEPRKFPQEWRTIVSIDPAATGTTAAIRARIAPNNDIYLDKEYYQANQIVSSHAKNILAKMGDATVDIWLIDPKWGTQRNAETHKTGMQLYRDAGIPVRLAEVNEDYGLHESREYISATVSPSPRHPKVFVVNDLHNFIYEIEHYVYDSFEKGPMKGLSKDKPRKRNDHLQNAFSYLCAMKPRGKKGYHIPPDEGEKRQFSSVNSYT